MGIADDDVFDPSFAVDEQPDLTIDFFGELGELAGDLLGDDGGRREAPLIEFFQPPQLVVFQALRVAVNCSDMSVLQM